MTVVEIVLEQTASGSSPEAIRLQHPDRTLGQIHSAPAYYWDHREGLDANIERRLAFADRTRQETGPLPLAALRRADA